SVFLLLLRRALCSTLFPYTTLFRSFDFVILTTSDNPPTIRGKRHSHNRTAMSLERVRSQAGGRIPHHSGLILAGSGDPVSEVKRSEEHTSELQSRSDFVCRLLLE